jgi:hypothetical protein
VRFAVLIEAQLIRNVRTFYFPAFADGQVWNNPSPFASNSFEATPLSGRFGANHDGHGRLLRLIFQDYSSKYLLEPDKPLTTDNSPLKAQGLRIVST